MTIQISAASEEDAGDLARLVILCNAQDQLFNVIMPREKNATAEQRAKHLRWSTEKSRMTMRRAGTYWFKAVDTLTGSTIGVAGTFAPQAGESEWIGVVSEAIDEEQYEKFNKATAEKKKELVGERDDLWELAYMHVHPEFQGRGIGSRLLAETNALAHKAGQDTYLVASPVGVRLYSKGGFERLGDIQMLDGEYVAVCMLRKAGLAP